MSTPAHRFHISDPQQEKLLETSSRAAAAFKIAGRYARRLGRPVEVFDTMARPGQPERWGIEEKETEHVTRGSIVVLSRCPQEGPDTDSGFKIPDSRTPGFQDFRF